MKVTEKFEKKVNWFIVLDVGTIFAKICYSWHVANNGMQLNCKLEPMVKIQKNAFYLR